MFKKLLVLSLASLSPLLAHASTMPPENPQIGRYQLVSATPHEGSVKIQLYLLDTVTGQVWKSKSKYIWTGEHDSWEPIISGVRGY